jgi:hypothetical protein
MGKVKGSTYRVSQKLSVLLNNRKKADQVIFPKDRKKRSDIKRLFAPCIIVFFLLLFLYIKELRTL